MSLTTKVHDTDTAVSSREAFINYVAVAAVTSPAKIISRAIVHVMCLASENRQTTDEVRQALLNRFAFEVPLHEVETTLRDLVNDGCVTKLADGIYEIDHEAVKARRERIISAGELEEVVRAEWLKETSLSYPSLDHAELWAAVCRYLGAALRRHGVQSAAFLYPELRFPKDDALNDSLTELLRSATSVFPEGDQALAENAISDFLAQAQAFETRRQWIGELADGAVNYFAFAAPPETSRLIRKNVEECTLFLDTNFLFGILDLHANPQVAASKDLVRMKTELGLPLKLTYHPATAAEMDETIQHYALKLRKRGEWPAALSRAALQSKALSGIERRYHALNAKTPLPVETFLRIYMQPDLLLPKQSISAAKALPEVDTSSLLAEYKQYLDRQKAMEATWSRTLPTMEHDATVLATILAMRANTSKIEASRIWLLTCDYHLYRFDLELAGRENREPCTLLPNVLWQALRASMTHYPDFDRSFAAVFAIPEFRTIGSAASAACSQVLAHLAATAGLDETVAARVLSNSMLMDRIRGQSYEDVRTQVELAIEQEGETLIEERAALAKRAAAEQAERVALDKTVSAQSVEIEELRRRLADLEKTEEWRKTEEARLHLDAQRQAARAARLGYVGGTILATAVAFLLNLAATTLHWTWLVRHPNRLPIVLLLALLVFCLTNATVNPRWRNPAWATAVFVTIVIAMISLSGGAPAGTTAPPAGDAASRGSSSKKSPSTQVPSR